MCYHYTIPAYEVDAVDSGSLSEITARLGLRRRYGSSSDFLNYIRICREYHRLGILCKWSGKRGSNPPPPPWQGGALPNELFPQSCSIKEPQGAEVSTVGAGEETRTHTPCGTGT